MIQLTDGQTEKQIQQKHIFMVEVTYSNIWENHLGKSFLLELKPVYI